MIFINRNVTIVVVILVLVVIAGYLIWIRSKFQSPVTPQPSPEVTVIPTGSPMESASPSASPGKEATGSTKVKSATSPATAK